MNFGKSEIVLWVRARICSGQSRSAPQNVLVRGRREAVVAEIHVCRRVRGELRDFNAVQIADQFEDRACVGI